jgi:mono/diheme cytochrome c family protein
MLGGSRLAGDPQSWSSRRTGRCCPLGHKHRARWCGTASGQWHGGAQGGAVFAANCQGCHGEKGGGNPLDRLVDGQGTLAGEAMPVKTVGSFWPYATTLFDYVRRAMPLQAPKSLTDDQVYAVSAYILHPASERNHW